MNKKAILIGAAVSALMAGGCSKFYGSKKSTSMQMAKGECWGINSCKGAGECGGKDHSCAGKNSCKGQGWLSMTKDECSTKGGTFKGN